MKLDNFDERSNWQMEYAWWQTGVIYQIYPRSFKDTTGNGVGDLQGIIEKLDYLADLGIDAIWISPFYPSPMKDFGYDVADYCDVDPMFGDLAKFDQLLADAHKRDIKVIIDWVPNHSSDEHPWFIESRSSRDNSKRDWYIWRDPKPDGSPPNNWGSFFGGPAWTLDDTTGQYYMHQFVPGQPELNWRNPKVKAAMFDTLRFWLDRGVDGFRMDVIGLIIKDKELRDNPVNPNVPDNLPENDLFGRLFQVYNMDQDDIHPVLREIRQLFDTYDARVAIGELWGPLERWVKYYGTGGDELHLPFNFRLMDESNWSAQTMRGLVDAMEVVLPDYAWPNYVLGNHDRIRLATRFGGQDQARLAALMLLTLRGTPTLYYGDELGIENGIIPAEKIQDPQGVNLGPERTRDVCRTPMQWNSSAFAGFSSEDPWLPVSVDYAERNVAVMNDDPASILSLYRALLAIRKGSVALQVGSYTPINMLTEDCYAYWREASGERYVIVLNFSDADKTVSFEDLGNGVIAFSTFLDRKGDIDLNEIRLRAYEGLMIKV
jgi:alpha-glucosidase